ncbi:MAG: DUF4396 domain-containing protein [Gammaproteobacteria bacterium]
MHAANVLSEFWRCRATWRRSAHNTKWCLVGCAFGDMATVFFFQSIEHGWTTVAVFALAMFNGLLTSVALETFILRRGGMALPAAFKTAMGMSFISMLAMETAMNLADFLITGGARITPLSAPVMLIAGFLAPWPYNYWRLKKYGKACH